MADKKDPFKADKGLEDQVKAMGKANLHPTVEKIQHRFGMMNVLRNQRNQKIVDLEEIDKES